jgi:hypothetical protein
MALRAIRLATMPDYDARAAAPGPPMRVALRTSPVLRTGNPRTLNMVGIAGPLDRKRTPWTSCRAEGMWWFAERHRGGIAVRRTADMRRATLMGGPGASCAIHHPSARRRRACDRYVDPALPGQQLPAKLGHPAAQ